MGSLLKNLSLPAYAAIGAALLLVAFVAFLWFTHAGWYDGMKAAEKVKFWTDFGVSFGTIALALVTWASVYETQQVLRGEDRRFRQSRMPMVRMHPAFPSEPFPYVKIGNDSITLAVLNDGDGPALKVRLLFRFIVSYERRVGTVGPPTSAVATQESELASSFLPPRNVATAEFPAPDKDNYAKSVRIEDLEICYDDLFGSPFVTRYENFIARPIAFRSGPFPTPLVI